MAEPQPAKKDSPKTRAAKAAAAKAAATARRKAKEKAVARATAVKNVKAKDQLAGFMGFIREQGVVGLAIGLVLGIQVKAVVDQIVASFLNPTLGLLLPGAGSLADKTFSLTMNGKEAVFLYGAFISVMISFVTVAALVYYGVKALRLDRLDKKKD